MEARRGPKMPSGWWQSVVSLRCEAMSSVPQPLAVEQGALAMAGLTEWMAMGDAKGTAKKGRNGRGAGRGGRQTTKRNAKHVAGLGGLREKGVTARRITRDVALCRWGEVAVRRNSRHVTEWRGGGAGGNGGKIEWGRLWLGTNRRDNKGQGRGCFPCLLPAILRCGRRRSKVDGATRSRNLINEHL